MTSSAGHPRRSTDPQPSHQHAWHKRPRRRSVYKCSLGVIVALIILLQTYSWIQISHTQTRDDVSLFSQWRSQLDVSADRQIQSHSRSSDRSRRIHGNSNARSHSIADGEIAHSIPQSQIGDDIIRDICAVPPGEGPELRWGFQAIIKVDNINLEAQLRSLRETLQADQPERTDAYDIPKVLCVVMTDSTRHSDVIPAILATYAQQCDGFVAVSNKTDATINAVNMYARDSIIRVDRSNDSTTGVDHRLYPAMQYIQKEFGDSQQFDFFHIASDQAYIYPNNLRYHLARIAWNVTGADGNFLMYMGDGMIPNRRSDQMFCTSGSGITFNSESLKVATASEMTKCMATASPQEQDTEEGDIGSHRYDTRLGHCLSAHAGIQKCQMGLDATDEASLYHEHGPNFSALWVMANHGPPIYGQEIMRQFGIRIRNKLMRTSRTTVSFHLVDGLESMEGTTASHLYRIHAIHQNLCDHVWKVSKGALDAAGHPGYVHDATYIKEHPLPFTERIPYYKRSYPFPQTRGICEVPYGSGSEEPLGNTALQKIRNFLVHELPAAEEPGGAGKKLRILCMVYTHSNSHDRVRAIAETYGPRCDGFMAASNVTDVEIGAVNILHDGPESYDNMWSKVRSIWRYVYEHYLDEYDFFHLGGDDHYVIVENLRHVVSTGSWRGPWNQSAPLYLGGPMVAFPNKFKRLCGGGAGYTLNRPALKLLVEGLFYKQDCWPYWQTPKEDYNIASCFRYADVLCEDTNDDRNETRYHQSNAYEHARWKTSGRSVWRAGDLELYHGITSKGELGQISETSVSFHLKVDATKRNPMPGHWVDNGVRRYDAILHDRCSDKSP